MNKRILGIIIIIFLVFLSYLPAIRGGFVWDDDSFLTDNPLIKASNGLKRFWASTEPPDYFPLTSTTLWLEWRLWGENAAGYHVTNILLHVISSMLIWLILLRLKIPGAWFAALIFAVHPVNAEAVAWITQRKSTLPMVFYLLSILFYINFENKENKLFYVFSILAFLLALLSKTSVIMLPFVLLGCIWWMDGKIEYKKFKRIIPFFATAFILGLVTIWFQYNRSIGDDIVRTDSFLSRAAGAGWVTWFYLYKALLPFKLCFVYPRWEIDPKRFISFVPDIILAISFIILFWKKNSWGKNILFGFGYFVVTLFPVMGFLNIYYMRYSLVADHYQYQSIIGVIALIVGLSSYGISKLHTSKQNIFKIMAAILVCLLCFLTWTQAKTYKNSEVLFRDSLSKAPLAWMPNYNLARHLQEEKRYAEAIHYYTEAFRLDPEDPSPLNNMGNIYLEKGDFDKTIQTFQKALDVNPNFGEGHYNMGKALLDMKNNKEATKHLYEAIRINPKNEKAHNNLGNALALQGMLTQANAHYNEALKIKPNFVDAHVNKGIVLKWHKSYPEALWHFQEALRLDPGNVKAQNNLKEVSRIEFGESK